MARKGTIPRQALGYNDGGRRVYFDATGRSHAGLSEIESLRLKNQRLVRYVARLLEERQAACRHCGLAAVDEVAR